MRPAARFVTVWMSCLLTVGVAAPSALAAVSPVDPGPAGAGVPISWVNMNLPPLDAARPYDAGDGFAKQIEAYYTSGQVRTDQAALTASARRWTRGWLRRECGGVTPAKVRACKAMAVFDIDETLLDNYTYYSTTSPKFSFIPATWAQYQSSCGAAGTEAVISLYSALRSWGMQIAVITGRSEAARAATTACLNARGVDGWATLVMQGPADAGLTAAHYKANARAALEKDGWKIGPSIGDQISDMSYGHLAHGFLLPDPIYYIP